MFNPFRVALLILPYPPGCNSGLFKLNYFVVKGYRYISIIFRTKTHTVFPAFCIFAWLVFPICSKWFRRRAVLRTYL